MPEQTYLDDLRLAHMMADNADSLAMSRFKALDLKVDAKPDLTPVSDADVAIEDAIRRTLKTARPRDAVHGEEREDTGWGPRRWVIDPIDGTKNFVRGVPVWATLIALMVENQVVVGVVSAPALSRRWWASAGGGAFSGKTLLQGNPCRVSAVSSTDDASLSYSSVHGWVDSGRGQQFVDVATEPELALHDMAALDVIVREAGGRFTNLDGVDGPGGPGAIATNGLLHDAVVQQLAE